MLEVNKNKCTSVICQDHNFKRQDDIIKSTLPLIRRNAVLFTQHAYGGEVLAGVDQPVQTAPPGAGIGGGGLGGVGA